MTPSRCSRPPRTRAMLTRSREGSDSVRISRLPPRRRPDGPWRGRKARGETRSDVVRGAVRSRTGVIDGTMAGGDAPNEALTLAPASRTRTVHGAVPTHAPLQPPNVPPAAGTALSDTALPAGNEASHVEAQARPGGSLRTLPGPAIATCTVRAGGPAGSSRRWSRLLPASATYTRSSVGAAARPAGATKPPTSRPSPPTVLHPEPAKSVCRTRSPSLT